MNNVAPLERNNLATTDFMPFANITQCEAESHCVRMEGAASGRRNRAGERVREETGY